MPFRHVLGKPDLDRPPRSIRQLLSTPPAQTSIAFLILYIATFQYLRHANYRDPTSYFFDPSRAYERIYSSVRIDQANKFIEAAGNAEPPLKGIASPLMCIGVATVARRGEQKVQSTVGSLLEGLTPSERESVYLDILVGHTEPSKHPIQDEKWLQTLPNNVLAYKDSDLNLIRTWEEQGQYRNKSIYDYTYLLKDCYDTGARYIAMVEDDTLAARGWFPQAIESLRKVEAAMHRRPGSKWIYMRLFYQDKLFGWNSEFWFTYLFWSFVVWNTALASLVWARSRSTKLQGFLTLSSMRLISCVCLPAMIGLYFMAGRNSMRPLSPGIHEMNKFGCCSQGYIFPRDIVVPFLAKTDLQTDWLVDMMVEQIANREGYIRWATVPSLLQHIGTTSSKGYGFDETAKNIWNFGFELRENGVP